MSGGAAAAPHAPHAGKCTTWVDDEMEARGLEAPMTSCCAKDAAQAAEAARVHAVLWAADPTRRAVELRAAAAPQAAPSGEAFCAAADDDESSDFSDDDGDGDGDGEDSAALAALRAARLAALRREAAQRAAQRTGDYLDVEEAQLPALAAAHPRLVLHFPLAGADACAQLDEHLAALARAHPRTRFARVQPLRGAAAGAGSPALAAMGGGVPPGLAVLRRGRPAAVAPGLGLFGGAAALQEARVTRWLQAARALPAGAESSSGDDDGDGDGSLGRGALTPPCPSCGRTYPHEHIRAVRAGGLAGSDSD